MSANTRLRIPFLPVKPKPTAKVVFIGRDPSPRTASIVGERGGQSTFINDVFSLTDEAGLPEGSVYITDLCKCHWRTSRGTPWPGTEDRNSKLPMANASICTEEWLFKEIRLLHPFLVVGFGEDVYQAFRRHITFPDHPPVKFSASRDKTKDDAENWIAQKGPMIISLEPGEYPFVAMRHAGNSGSLPRKTPEDLRWLIHQKVRRRTIATIRSNTGG